MDPIVKPFDSTKKQIMGVVSAVLEPLGLQLNGCSGRLGLIGIKQKNKPMLYAHIVEHANGTTDISIAPGLAYLKDRGNPERPDSTILKILNEWETVLGSNK